MLRRTLYALAYVLSAPGLAWAVPYLAADSIPPMLLDTPPPVHSERWTRDIEAIAELQREPDAGELAEAAAERHLTSEMMARHVMPSLTRERFPTVYAWLDRVGETSDAVSDAAKSHWGTKRPYLMDKRVEALIEPHDNPAYPSGHTTDGYVLAHALALLWPEKKQAFYDRAEEIAQHRVLVGMHYPHDLAGGRQMALLIVGGLLQNQEFQADLARAREEAKTQGLLR